MVNVPSARQFGFRLELNEGPMRDLLNSAGTKKVLADQAVAAKAGVEGHVRATASPADADNYVGNLEVETNATSDQYGFDFSGPYALGNRPIALVLLHPYQGANPRARLPFVTEARTHAMSSVAGFQVGKHGEDVT